MLQPKRTKFRKRQKGRVKGLAGRGHTLAFGTFTHSTARMVTTSTLTMSEPSLLLTSFVTFATCLATEKLSLQEALTTAAVC